MFIFRRKSKYFSHNVLQAMFKVHTNEHVFFPRVYNPFSCARKSFSSQRLQTHLLFDLLNSILFSIDPRLELEDLACYL